MILKDTILFLMHINFHSFSNQAISSLKENILPTLTAQQKKILVIASIALGFLAALYLAGRRCFTAELLEGQGKKTFPDGTIGEGEFKGGMLHGQAKKTYPDKALEKSDLEHSSQKLPDGTIGEGEFKGGMLHGQGKKNLSRWHSSRRSFRL